MEKKGQDEDVSFDLPPAVPITVGNGTDLTGQVSSMMKSFFSALPRHDDDDLHSGSLSPSERAAVDDKFTCEGLLKRAKRYSSLGGCDVIRPFMGSVILPVCPA